MNLLTKVAFFMLIAGALKRLQIEIRKDLERMSDESEAT
jgi:hypothetical protein